MSLVRYALLLCTVASASGVDAKPRQFIATESPLSVATRLFNRGHPPDMTAILDVRLTESETAFAALRRLIEGYKLFGLNTKPNMTGPRRQGRDDQHCLSAIAARADGWRYVDLLRSMLAARWKHASTSSSR